MSPIHATKLGLIAGLAAVLCHCGAAGEDVEQSGDTGAESALTVSGCTPSAILAAAPDDTRRAILKRALAWVDDEVPYSQSSTHGGYRTDCSGLVSMAWQLARPGATTASLAPYDTSSSQPIAWDELAPGDALNVHEGGLGHAMLFAGWRDDGHTSACVIQENRTGTPANIRGYTSGWLDRFHPIRANGLGSGGGGGGGASGGTKCWSPTLQENVGADVCVQSASNEIWYQCVDGEWVDGVADGEGPAGTCVASHSL
jgi:cell wall-associated NlpC family hydrolase